MRRVLAAGIDRTNTIVFLEINTFSNAGVAYVGGRLVTKF